MKKKNITNFHLKNMDGKTCQKNIKYYLKKTNNKFPSKKADGQTCLHLACARGEENIIRTLYLARFNKDTIIFVFIFILPG